MFFFFFAFGGGSKKTSPPAITEGEECNYGDRKSWDAVIRSIKYSRQMEREPHAQPFK